MTTPSLKNRHNMRTREDAIAGSLLGTAVGDALGLPYEGLTAARGRRMLGEPDRHRFVCGRGMTSDDTEHTCLVAQSWCVARGDLRRFERDFARRLRWWLAGLPAGVGRATARSILRLWLGRSPQSSGVFSAGNGPAMRAAVLGAAVDDLDQLKSLIRAATRVTHTDPQAEWAALAVAVAAQVARASALEEAAAEEATTEGLGARYMTSVRLALAPASAAPSPPEQREQRQKLQKLLDTLQRAADSARRGESTPQFAAAEGWERGVSGYCCHSVPAALHAWLRHPNDFRAAVSGVIRCGGDTDSNAAIAGGVVGSGIGADAIPAEWLNGIWEWPRSVSWMRRLSATLAVCADPDVDESSAGKAANPPRAPWWGLVARNLFFLAVVLAHAGRRALPPY